MSGTEFFFNRELPGALLRQTKARHLMSAFDGGEGIPATSTDTRSCVSVRLIGLIVFMYKYF